MPQSLRWLPLGCRRGHILYRGDYHDASKKTYRPFGHRSYQQYVTLFHRTLTAFQSAAASSRLEPAVFTPGSPLTMGFVNTLLGRLESGIQWSTHIVLNDVACTPPPEELDSFIGERKHLHPQLLGQLVSFAAVFNSMGVIRHMRRCKDDKLPMMYDSIPANENRMDA